MSSEQFCFADSLIVQTTNPTHAPSDWAGFLGRWLIFVSGLVVLVAALILPAQIDLRETRIQRDLALHIEQSQHTRIDRYQEFLKQLESPSASTVDLLAMSQLGIIPDDREALIVQGKPADPQLFEFLEPTQPAFEPRVMRVSHLEEFTTGSRSRLWVVLIGAVAVMYGLLPAAKS